MLKKNKVEVDGIQKVVVLVNDVTDKVRLEQESRKKEQEKQRMCLL